MAHGRDQDATFAPSPEPPDDVQVADFVQRYSVADSSEHFDLYLVSSRRWENSLPSPNNLQYNGRGIDGRGVSYVLNPWSYFHNGVQLTLKDRTIDPLANEIATTGMPDDNDEATKICIGLCSENAAANGEDVFRGSWSGDPKKCYCAYGAASFTDQEAPLGDTNVLDGTSFIASRCPNSVPDPTESRYVWTKNSRRRWCSGAVSQDHAGTRHIASSLLPTLIDPADRAETCQTLCASNDECQVAELHTVSWNDVAGAVLAAPPVRRHRPLRRRRRRRRHRQPPRRRPRRQSRRHHRRRKKHGTNCATVFKTKPRTMQAAALLLGTRTATWGELF